MLTTVDQAASLLAKVGVTAESACACGLTPEEVGPLFQVAADLVDSRRSELNASEQRVLDARRSFESVTNRRASEAPPADSEIAQARQELDASVSALNAAYAVVFEQLAATMRADVRAALTVWHGNSGEPLPAYFKVVSRTPEESKALQEALRHVQARTRAGLAADAARRAVVTAAEANAAVVVAKGYLESRATSIQMLWHSATE